MRLSCACTKFDKDMSVEIFKFKMSFFHYFTLNVSQQVFNILNTD